MAHPSILAPRCDEIRVSPRTATALGTMVPPLVPPMVPPVVLLPRRVPGGVLATLDALPEEALPRLDYEGPASGLRRAMRAALAERLPRPRWLANWLLDDVLDHAAMLTALSGATSLRARLEVVRTAAQVPLAAPAARSRLVTAYRGPGLDWLPPRAAAGLAEGEAPPAGLLRRLPRGDVAILRGDGDAPGVAHRAVSGPGAPLLLTIDEADRPRRAARPFAERPAGALQ